MPVRWMVRDVATSVTIELANDRPGIWLLTYDLISLGQRYEGEVELVECPRLDWTY